MIRVVSQHPLQPTAANLYGYAIRMSIVLSLMLSLAGAVIASKNHVPNYGWISLAALLVPLSLLSLFRHRIAGFGPAVYVVALILILSAAVLFGL